MGGRAKNTASAKDVAQEGCSLVFKGVSKADCKAFCQQLCNAIKDTRSKKSATSGQKLPPAVFRLLSV